LTKTKIWLKKTEFPLLKALPSKYFCCCSTKQFTDLNANIMIDGEIIIIGNNFYHILRRPVVTIGQRTSDSDK